jgi:hypothetical protein
MNAIWLWASNLIYLSLTSFHWGDVHVHSPRFLTLQEDTFWRLIKKRFQTFRTPPTFRQTLRTISFTTFTFKNKVSVVSIATVYELAVRGSNPGGGEIFSTPPDRPWGLINLIDNGYQASFSGVKRPGRGVDHPPQFSAEVKERVELYLYSHSGPSWPVLGWTLPYL